MTPAPPGAASINARRRRSREPLATAREPQEKPGGPSIGWAIGTALVTLAIYLVHAPPVAGDKDSAEFTLVLALRGVSHPTGYPLYTLIGHGFVTVLHALGCSWALAANAWSAVGGAVAVFFMVRLAGMLAPGSRSAWNAALLPALVFALDPVWTVETELAEVNSWHVAWVMGAALAFVGIARALARGDARLPDRAALGWGFLCGIGAAHHLTSLPVSAALSAALAIALWRGRALVARALGLGVLGFALPLGAYGWIAWRAFHPGAFQWPLLEPTWSSLIAHVTGRMYGFRLGYFAPSEDQRRLLAAYVYPVLAPALALAALAVWRARDAGERFVLGALAAAAALATLQAFTYGVPDPSSYFLAPMALGLAAGASLVARVDGRGGRIALAALALLLVALDVAWLGVGARRREAYVQFDQLLTRMWRSIPVERGIVCWASDSYYQLLIRQRLEGEKRELEVVDPWLIVDGPARARFASAHGFDPMQGLTLPRDASGRVPDTQAPAMAQLVTDIEHAINAHTVLPVIHFDPTVPTVGMYQKGTWP